MLPKSFGPLFQQLPLLFALGTFAVGPFGFRDATLINAVHWGGGVWCVGCSLKGGCPVYQETMPASRGFFPGPLALLAR